VEVRALRGSNADAVIGKLNPIINGWCAYCVSRGRARLEWRAVA
jgi:hypothetical protein